MDALKEIVPLGPDCSKHTTLGVLTKARHYVETRSEEERRLEEEVTRLRAVFEGLQTNALAVGFSQRRLQRITGGGSVESLPSSPEPMDDDEDSSTATRSSSSSYSPSLELESSSAPQWSGVSSSGIVSDSPPRGSANLPRFEMGGSTSSLLSSSHGNGKILQPYRSVPRGQATSSSTSLSSSVGATSTRYNPLFSASRAASASITIPGSNRGSGRTGSPTGTPLDGSLGSFSRRFAVAECQSLPAKPVARKMTGLRVPSCASRATSIPRFRVFEGR